MRGGFIWDDDSWTTNIVGLLRDFSGLCTLWSHPTALQQYYPLAGTTFWIDYHLWEFWTLPYHVENVLLHTAAALLFWQLLRRLGVPGAWLAAGVFALHPVMVESVAWITERKNVLSLVFFLGSLLAYGRYVAFWEGKDEVEAPRRRSIYVLALVLFLGALFSKTTTVSLPAVILLLEWWKRGSIRWRRDVLPTLPFFALALGLSMTTYWLEQNHVGAKGADFAMTFPERCLIAGRVPWFYIGKLLWPVNLCFVYPRWGLEVASWWQWIYPATALAALFAFWLARGRIGRGPATGVFFFVGTLFPVLGFVNAYGMRYAFVWDHWVYLSSLGLIVVVTALVVRGIGRGIEFRGLAVVVLLVLSILTWRECRAYTDLETLWRTTIARNPNCWMAYNNLGKELFQKGRVDEAMSQFQEAIRQRPKDAEAYCGLGAALGWEGRIDEAIAQIQKAVQLEPNDADAHNNLGNAMLRKGRISEAISQYQEAIRLKPDYAEAHCNLGTAFGGAGQVDGAINQYREALHLNPDYAEAHCGLGTVLGMKGETDEAIRQFQEALRLKPDYAGARRNLEHALEIKNAPAAH
jgi:tetratricopeptide (TPR) repeat protein